MTDSKNDIAWKHIFEKYKIIESISQNGKFEITSSQINEFREARLMTKFDYKSQLPVLFSKHNLSILPISRGSYVISDFETFVNFDKNETEIIRVDFPTYLESIDYGNITSESIALNCAYISDMIQNFVEDEELKPTVTGRMSSSSFSFNIKSKMNGSLNISVDNSQIEIDGGFEGFNYLTLIEAKNVISDNFLIRQLYYPYRLWSNKIRKPVKVVFLTFSNGIFHFREYAFENINCYNSIQLIKQKKYIIREEAINTETIQKILREITIKVEPKVSFPQADSFERVINLCEQLNKNESLGKKYITQLYNFADRQSSYYTDAGIYLGLVYKYNDKNHQDDKIRFSLTENGKKLFNFSISNRQLEFVKLILSHLAFNKALTLYFDKNSPPIESEVVKIMKESGLYRIVKDSTFERRASTISGWINWIFELIEE